MSGTLMAVPAGTHEALYLEDRDLEALGLDAWSARGWSGEDLRLFAVGLRTKLASRREAIERAVLAEHRKKAVEPWMAPLVEKELAADAACAVIGRILPLVEETATRGARLLYEID